MGVYICVCVWLQFCAIFTSHRSAEQTQLDAEYRGGPTGSHFLSNGLQLQRLRRWLRLLLCLSPLVYMHCCCFTCCYARTYVPLSLSLPFFLFALVVVNCSSLLSCTLHNAPL